MVHLQRFHEKYVDKGLQVFVISMHPDAKEARKLTQKLKATYPIFDGKDSDLGNQYAYG
jgi:hypothetical protein